MGPGCWRRTGSSRHRRGLIEGMLGEGKNVMHLLSTDRREPLQELVYGRAAVEVFEQRGNRQAGTSEAPCPAQLSGVSVDSAAKAPVHTVSLSLIGRPPVRSRLDETSISDCCRPRSLNLN